MKPNYGNHFSLFSSGFWVEFWQFQIHLVGSNLFQFGYGRIVPFPSEFGDSIGWYSGVVVVDKYVASYHNQ